MQSDIGHRQRTTAPGTSTQRVLVTPLKGVDSALEEFGSEAVAARTAGGDGEADGLLALGGFAPEDQARGATLLVRSTRIAPVLKTPLRPSLRPRGGRMTEVIGRSVQLAGRVRWADVEATLRSERAQPAGLALALLVLAVVGVTMASPPPTATAAQGSSEGDLVAASWISPLKMPATARTSGAHLAPAGEERPEPVRPSGPAPLPARASAIRAAATAAMTIPAAEAGRDAVSAVGSPLGVESAALDATLAPLATALEHSATPLAPEAVGTAKIRDALSRYRRAFNGLDAGSARAVWPTVNVQALSRAFERLETQSFEFDSCAITLGNAKAVATCSGSATYVPRVGNRRARSEPRHWRFDLRQRDGEWLIETVDSR